MTDREKIGHLLRRFGLGASQAELDEYSKLGVDGTIRRLIDFKPATEELSPLRFAFRPKGDAETGGYRFRMHWLYQFATTKTPLREKMSLFWHDHFAADDNKVEDGLAMLDYIETIRANPTGKFRDILHSMAKSPAVMKMLDVRMMTKAVPNENFARELMELYTLSVGHYTEADIKHIARALTGWMVIDTYYTYKGNNRSKLERMIAYDMPYTAYAYAPDMHATGPKPVLGKTVDTGDDVLNLLAASPSTARFICKKLWEFFAYKNPEDAVLNRMVANWQKNDGSIKALLYEIARSPEFWSDKCVRNLIKSPVAYTFGLTRAFGVDDVLKQQLGAATAEYAPVPEVFANTLGGLGYWCDQMGQDLYYPPSVKGWDWHEAWISTNTLMRRHQFQVPELYVKEKVKGKDVYNPGPPLQRMLAFVKAKNPQSSLDVCRALTEFVDCPMPEESLTLLAERADKRGGMNATKNDGAYAYMCLQVIDLMRSSPEFQIQ